MLKKSARKVQETLNLLGFSYEVIELPSLARTAKEAAEAVGCRVAQIAKSLVFKTKHTHKPILVIASGINRVNEGKISKIVSEPIEKADPDFVREKTGFVIGGVPPVGHKEKIDTFIDKELLSFNEIWAAAGHPYAVFKLTPKDLVVMTKGKVISVK